MLVVFIIWIWYLWPELKIGTFFVLEDYVNHRGQSKTPFVGFWITQMIRICVLLQHFVNIKCVFQDIVKTIYSIPALPLSHKATQGSCLPKISWSVEKLLKWADLDVCIFKVRSTRAASTSKANVICLCLEGILEKVSGSSSFNWQRFI